LVEAHNQPLGAGFFMPHASRLLHEVVGNALKKVAFTVQK
jgi:hypothetical protein